MTIKIGRFKGNVAGVERSGDNLTVSGLLRDQHIPTAVSMQQFSGLLGNADEPVVPVICEERPDLDGFYRVGDGSITEVRKVTKSAGVFRWTISLRRVGNSYAFASSDLFTGSATRTNAHAVTGRAIMTSMPDFPNRIQDDKDWLSLQTPYWCADGALDMENTSPSGDTTPIVYSSFMPPELHYYGAARIEAFDGDSWYEVVGRQLPITTTWRITNGMLRLTSGDAAGVSPGTIELWTGTAWHARTIRHFSAIGDPDAPIGLDVDDGRSPIVILRNSPETVVVRCMTSFLTMDYVLRRGAMHAECLSGARLGIGFDASDITQCVIGTGSLDETAYDANGNKVSFGFASAFSSSPGFGKCWPTAGVSSAGFVGMHNSARYGNPSMLVEQFLGMSRWQQRMVAQ